MQKHSVAFKAAQFLEKSPHVTRVLYPLLQSHPTYSVNVKYLTNGGPGIAILFRFLIF